MREEGSVRLVGGRTESEGNVEVYHGGVWGSVCDDEWDLGEAHIVCRSLGFPGAETATHGGKFGAVPGQIWMDNLYCYGTEERLDRCRFDGWGQHDCDRSEGAGVVCREPPPPLTTSTSTTARPLVDILKVVGRLEARLAGGRTEQEGRVEVRLGQVWGGLCADGWTVREAMVVCRQLGLNYAAAAVTTDVFGQSPAGLLMSGLSCSGSEARLEQCRHHQGGVWCPHQHHQDVAGVVCVDHQADLQPDMMELMQSAYLEDKPLFLLQCAMEENCLASEAYRERQENPYWQQLTRRLLRFTTAIENIGTADFKPFRHKAAWQWHACHQHFHSMETFSHFEILDFSGRRMVEGHKASFCLEDNQCRGGAGPHYDCENYGEQGISAGCRDIYYNNIDCQWIDITDLEVGNNSIRHFFIETETFH